MCGAEDARLIWVIDGEFRQVAQFGTMPHAHANISGFKITRGTVTGRAFLERRTVHVEDLAAVLDFEYPDAKEFQAAIGHRTTLATPLIRDGESLGVLLIRRGTVAPFADKQIKLLETFADQAVIAIENTRLFEEVQDRTKELTESLEYQTAISEVLGVISRSPTDVQPVFDTIARSALDLCGGTFSSVLRFDGRLIHFVAAHGMTREGFEALRSTYPLPPGRAGATTRAIETAALAEIPDVEADRDFEHRHVAGAQNFKSLASVPMLKDGRPIGTITVGQGKTGRFPERQIVQLRTFADQAVIAIENARLFEEVQSRTRELTELLEYQTATSEVLNVISRSPAQLQPVLDAIAETAARLCQAEYAFIWKLAAGRLDLAAANNAVTEYVKWTAANPPALDRGSLAGRVTLERATIHIPDVLADPEYTRWDSQRLQNFRSVLGVPLLRDGQPIGVVNLVRTEVKPFTDKEIELVTTFADQAVIAIENTRLFEEVQARTRELSEALEQQTSSAKVLSVISATPGEVRPVFDTILEEATRLCEAKFGVLHRFDGTTYTPVGVRGGVPELLEHFKSGHQPSAANALGRILHTKQPVHLADAREGPGYKSGDSAAKAVVEVGGARSYLLVPLLKDNDVIGAITIFRQEVRPFSAKQIQLLSSFANQAVIAIENARLFDELQSRTKELTESLEYQIAMSDVLGVISKSPNDAQPVFDTIASSALKLCGAKWSVVTRFDGERMHLAAMHNMSDPAGVEFDPPYLPARSKPRGANR